MIGGRLVVRGKHRKVATGSITLKIYPGLAGATPKRTVSDAGDAVGDDDAGRIGATERPVSDGCD